MGQTQNEFLHSVNLNAGSAFPYLVLEVVDDQSYPGNPGFQVMHWHEDLQFIYVLEGAIEIKTLHAAARVGAGSGVFINQNVVHLVEKQGVCHYKSFLFPDYFLKFYFGSPASACVERIVGKQSLPLYQFTRELPRHQAILSALKALADLKQEVSELYPYEVLVLLSTLWLAVRKEIQLPAEACNPVLDARMRQFLQHIEQHYGEDLSLDLLAGSANVSRSECLRCFKKSLQTTPYRYLIEFRLSKAAELLKHSDATVSEIAERVGFRQVSHFGKCFKEKTGYAPSAYRKQR